MFVQLILPQPPRRQVEPRRPTIGPSASECTPTEIPEAARFFFFSRFPDEITDELSWEWNGESDVRLILPFHRGTEDFTHEFPVS